MNKYYAEVLLFCCFTFSDYSTLASYWRRNKYIVQHYNIYIFIDLSHSRIDKLTVPFNFWVVQYIQGQVKKLLNRGGLTITPTVATSYPWLLPPVIRPPLLSVPSPTSYLSLGLLFCYHSLLRPFIRPFPEPISVPSPAIYPSLFPPHSIYPSLLWTNIRPSSRQLSVPPPAHQLSLPTPTSYTFLPPVLLSTSYPSLGLLPWYPSLLPPVIRPLIVPSLNQYPFFLFPTLLFD